MSGHSFTLLRERNASASFLTKTPYLSPYLFATRACSLALLLAGIPGIAGAGAGLYDLQHSAPVSQVVPAEVQAGVNRLAVPHIQFTEEELEQPLEANASSDTTAPANTNTSEADTDTATGQAGGSDTGSDPNPWDEVHEFIDLIDLIELWVDGDITDHSPADVNCVPDDETEGLYLWERLVNANDLPVEWYCSHDTTVCGQRVAGLTENGLVALGGETYRVRTAVKVVRADVTDTSVLADYATDITPEETDRIIILQTCADTEQVFLRICTHC